MSEANERLFMSGSLPPGDRRRSVAEAAIRDQRERSSPRKRMKGYTIFSHFLYLAQARTASETRPATATYTKTGTGTGSPPA